MNDALWPPTKTKQLPAPARLRRLREVDHLGHVGEVVQREADRVGGEVVELAQVVGVPEDLQVEQADVVACRPDRRGHALEPEGLEAQVQLGVHQRARVDEEDSHLRIVHPARPLF